MTTGDMQASSTGEPSCIMQQQSCMLDSHEATEEDQSAYSIDRCTHLEFQLCMNSLQRNSCHVLQLHLSQTFNVVIVTIECGFGRVAERTSALPCSQIHTPDQAGTSSGVQLVGRGACVGSEANMPVGVGEAPAQGQPQGSFMQMLVEGAAPG